MNDDLDSQGKEALVERASAPSTTGGQSAPNGPPAPTGKALRKALLEALPKMAHEGFGLAQATAIQGADELEAIVDVDAEAYVVALAALTSRRGPR